MSEDPSAAKPRGQILRWALWGAAFLGVAAVLYIMAQAMTKQAPTAPSPAPGASSAAFQSKFKVLPNAGPAPDLVFYDEAGKPRTLADFKGKVVVMNIWATWCAPCVTEMPTLAKLQAAYADKPVEVVAISIDSESSALKAKLFIAGNDPLKFYHDRNMKLPFALKPAAPGAPTTVIYGADGVERGRVEGEVDWSGPDARALIDKVLAEG